MSLLLFISFVLATTVSRRTGFLFTLLPFTLLTNALSIESKVRLLALSIPLSLVQIPRFPIPYQTSISELILLVLLLDDLLLSNENHKSRLNLLKPAAFIPFGLFTMAGLIANIGQGDFATWNVYCLAPLITFYLISRKLRSLEDAWLFVRFSLLTMVGFLIIIKFAYWTGHYYEYDPFGNEGNLSTNYRAADGMMIYLGPIRHYLFATRLGAIAALGLPACVLLFIRKEGHRVWRVGLLGIMSVLIYAIILSATRGSFVAAIIGSFLVILVSGRFRLRMLLSSAVLLILIVCGDSLFHYLPADNIQRLMTLSQGVKQIENYVQRMDVLTFSWELTLKHPLGVGFGHLYHNFQMDDAIIYAVILQGTGLLGAIAFAMIVLQMVLKFTLGILKSDSESVRDLASIGLSTLATGLIAGISSQSILFEPVHSFVFWMLMAVCHRAVACFSGSSAAQLSCDPNRARALAGAS